MSDKKIEISKIEKLIKHLQEANETIRKRNDYDIYFKKIIDGVNIVIGELQKLIKETA